MANNSLFTYTDDIEGKIGIGKLPDELQSILNEISKEYYDMIPDKNASTFHSWYSSMPTELKSKVEKFDQTIFGINYVTEVKNALKVVLMKWMNYTILIHRANYGKSIYLGQLVIMIYIKIVFLILMA